MGETISLIERIERLLPKEPVEALAWCGELRGIALEKRKEDLLVQEKGLRGRGYIATSRVQEGRQSVASAVAWYREKHLLDRGSSLINSVGADFYQLRSYHSAREWLALAVHSAVNAQAPQVLYKSLYNLGKVDQQEGDLASARKYLEKSLEVANRTDAGSGMYSLLGSLGSVHRGLGNYQEAERLLKSGKQMAQDKREWAHALSLGTDVGELLLSLRRYRESIVLFREAASAAEEQRMVRYGLTALIGLGKAQCMLGEGEAALQALGKAEKYISRYPSLGNPMTFEIYKYLALVYQKHYADQEEAYRHYVRYRNAVDSYRQETGVL